MSAPKSKKTTKADNRKRKVALLAANGQTTKQIAQQVDLTERRVNQLLSLEEVVRMKAHFELTVQDREVKAHALVLETLESKLKTPKWEVAAALIIGRLRNGEEARKASPQVQPSSAVTLNQQINHNGPTVTLDDLLQPFRPVEVDEQ